MHDTNTDTDNTKNNNVSRMRYIHMLTYLYCIGLDNTNAHVVTSMRPWSPSAQLRQINPYTSKQH